MWSLLMNITFELEKNVYSAAGQGSLKYQLDAVSELLLMGGVGLHSYV